MWTCEKCGESSEDQFDSCWRCARPRVPAPADLSASPAKNEIAKPRWRLEFKVFRGVLTSWEALFREAAAFATEQGPERVASLSHSEDRNDGVVTVWYWTSDWTNDDEPTPAGPV